MALQLALGKNALASLGVGVGDIVTLYNLGRRFGNWLTASEDDQKLLKLLDCDELDVLKRRGLIDLNAFNKRWSQSISLLVNGRPVRKSGDKIKEALGDLTRFTACMMVIVAVLDAFMPAMNVKYTMKRLLDTIFSTTSAGELVLSMEIDTRINAWRSAACVRDLHLRARDIRKELLFEGLIQEGYIPDSDFREVVIFLQWLLADTAEEMTTPSSDVAGIAVCLSRMTFDILRVVWPGQLRHLAPCTLIYDNTKTIGSSSGIPNFMMEGLSGWRAAKTVVPVDHPEEAISSFPISSQDGNLFRKAWNSGKYCGELIELILQKPIQADINDGNDLRYNIVDRGHKCGRVDDGIFALVEMQAFSVSHETCEALAILLYNETKENMNWIIKQLRDTPSWTFNIMSKDGKVHIERTGPVAQSDEELASLYIQDVRLSDKRKIYVFTLVQSFFLGYYYGIVLKAVDTSFLYERVVDGCFSYRSPTLLKTMQSFVKGDLARSQSSFPVVGVISRQRLFEMLPVFLFSLQIKVDHTRRNQWLIGMIGDRALLASSLLSPTVTPSSIAKLTLLDTDISSIPCNRQGAVMSGSQPYSSFRWDSLLVEQPPRRVVDSGPDEDFTMHIEAEWDVDLELTLICVRYKGRRVGVYSPLCAEKLFLMAYVEPVPSPRPLVLDQAIPCTVKDILESKINYNKRCPVLVLARGKPCMRYAVVAISNSTTCTVASNCVQTAAEQLPELTNGLLGHFVIGCEE